MVVIRWKDMFAVLENAIDATETAAQILEGIVIKNSDVSSDVILVIVVGTALAFDFTNGFHDTANVVATSISTGAARPQVAIGDRLAAQLRRRLHLDLGRGDGRQRRRQRRRDHADDRLRRPDRGDRLEPDHLVLRPALELLARADRRRRRLGGRGGRLRRGARRRPGRQGADPGGDRADPRLRRRRARDRARLPGRRQAAARAPSPAASATARSSPAGCWRSPTAPTTRRRRWA